MKEAWGQNAVITQDDGRNIRWKPRCPQCGHVPVNRDNGGTAMEGIRASYSERCDKCGARIDVIISRG